MSQLIEVAGYRHLDERSQVEIGQEIPKTSILSRFTSRIFTNSPQPSQYVVNKCTLAAARTAAFAVGMIGNISFIPVIKKTAHGNEALEDVLITCSVLGFGVLTSWLLIKIVNQSLQKQSPEEKQLFSGRLSTTTKTTVLATSAVLGICSQLPTAYMAYAYNEREAPIPLISASILVISNFSQPTYSTKLSIENFLKWTHGKCHSSPFKDQLDTSRQILIGMLSSSLETFLQKSPEERGSFLESLDSINSTDADNKTKSSQILAHICSLLPESTVVSNVPGKTNWMKELGFLATNTPFALSLLSLYWLAGYKAVYDFSSNEGGSAVAATFVTACNTHLVFLALKTVLESTYNKSHELVSGKLKKSLAFQVSPTSAVTSYISSLFLASFCYPGAWQISQDYYENKGYWPTTIGALSSIANCSLVAYSLFAVTEEIVPRVLGKIGDKNQKEIVRFANQINKFIEVIRECPDEIFANFLLRLPNNAAPGSANIFANLQIDRENIDEYLQTRSDTLALIEEEAINEHGTSFTNYGTLEA